MTDLDIDEEDYRTLEGNREDGHERQIRNLLDLDDDEEFDWRTIKKHLQGVFADLEEAGFEARPHTKFSLDRAEFEKALDGVLNGEIGYIDPGSWYLSIEDSLDRGFLEVHIHLRTKIEWEIGKPEEVLDEAAVPGAKEIIQEYYSEDVVQLIMDTQLPGALPDWYTTLLRDMDESCRRSVDIMHEVVDERPDLYWGGEPIYTGGDGLYRFSTKIYLRDYE